ncbi:uncharacterized protein L201_006902 [Kwoniella dendrophila CBS 6074]|uniref:ubiquitinyl hydrolase 1 n=1 Tax=Kwoniella dendrophila CBS 6074 TaxID=1295534 RepID=A0AAX4K577_9TREE
MTNSVLPPSLKRPRSTSPSTSSSPKRANSEDPFSSNNSDSGSVRPDFLLSNSTSSLVGNNNSMVGTSSPLRADNENDVDETGSNNGSGSGNLVKRTQEVKLCSSDDGNIDVNVDEEADKTITQTENNATADNIWKERYSELLAPISPPFIPYDRYYILPKPTLDKLKQLAYEHDGASSSLPPTSYAEELKAAMTRLVPDQSDETFWVIQSTETQSGSGEFTLIGEGKEEQVWALGDAEENRDFVFIASRGWKKIVEWFGPYDGPSLPRYCVPPENIEIQPAIIRLFIVLPSTLDHIKPNTDEAAQVELMCPSTTPMPIFKEFVKSVAIQKLKVSTPDSSSPIRLWKIEKTPENDEKLLSSGPLIISSSALIETINNFLPAEDQKEDLAEAILGNSKNQIIAIEFGKIENDKKVWNVDISEDNRASEKKAAAAAAPLFSKPAFFGGSITGLTVPQASTSSNTGAVQTRSQSQHDRKGKGLVGLQNLGNTCFMNSAVQCLSNTQELNEYFLSGVYTEELNRDNPLGMHGKIAEAFGEVIENLWSSPTSSYHSYSPRTLKYTTSRFAPQFAGYGQHDTQEFIAFLLDGLHEDLNRIIKKPYIEKPDWKAGGGEKELAELGKECWDGYKKRNDSVIVDLFQGQLQSTLVCPECHKESITMDPFMYLTVPLPIAQHRHMKMIFVPYDVEKPPMIVRLLVPQNASFAQVKDRLAAITGSKAYNLLGFDLWHGRPYAFWLDSDHNSEAKDNDVMIFYELATPVIATRKSVGTVPTDDSVTVPVYTFKSRENRSRYGNDYPSECHAKPFFITLSKSDTTKPSAVREAIIKGYTRLIRPDMKDHLYVHASSSKAVIPTPTTPKQEEDTDKVTEIHLNGDQTTVIEVTADNQGDAMDVDSPNPSTTNTSGGLHASPSSVSLASQGSTSGRSIAGSVSGHLVPRTDLFKIHVSEAASDSVFNSFKSREKINVHRIFTKEPNDASSSWSSLESRKKPKKSYIKRMTAMVSSSRERDRDSEDEGNLSDSSASHHQQSQPVIRPGEGIYCEWPSQLFDEWLDEGIMGDDIIDPAIDKEIAKKKEGKKISIEDCLDEFSKEETLGEDDLWYCPVCKKHQAATKKLEIYKAPDILVICIKRFGSSRRMGDKLDNLVQFPIDGLDLGERIGEKKVATSLRMNGSNLEEFGIDENDSEEMIYDLYAVDNHFGGMGGGHYTAFCRNRIDGQWYNYDDSRVSKADVESVQSRAAYLLFYRRRTKRPIGGISRIKAEEASRNASRATSPHPSSPTFGSGSGLARPNLPTLTSARDDDDGAASPSSDHSDSLPGYSSNSSSESLPPTPNVPSPRLSEDEEIDLFDPPITTTTTRFTTAPTTNVDVTPSSSNYETSEETKSTALDLSQLGSKIGFGNNAWVSSTSTSTSPDPNTDTNTSTSDQI